MKMSQNSLVYKKGLYNNSKAKGLSFQWRVPLHNINEY